MAEETDTSVPPQLTTPMIQDNGHRTILDLDRSGSLIHNIQGQSVCLLQHNKGNGESRLTPTPDTQLPEFPEPTVQSEECSPGLKLLHEELQHQETRREEDCRRIKKCLLTLTKESQDRELEMKKFANESNSVEKREKHLLESISHLKCENTALRSCNATLTAHCSSLEAYNTILVGKNNRHHESEIQALKSEHNEVLDSLKKSSSQKETELEQKIQELTEKNTRLETEKKVKSEKYQKLDKDCEYCDGLKNEMKSLVKRHKETLKIYAAQDIAAKKQQDNLSLQTSVIQKLNLQVTKLNSDNYSKANEIQKLTKKLKSVTDGYKYLENKLTLLHTFKGTVFDSITTADQTYDEISNSSILEAAMPSTPCLEIITNPQDLDMRKDNQCSRNNKLLQNKTGTISQHDTPGASLLAKLLTEDIPVDGDRFKGHGTTVIRSNQTTIISSQVRTTPALEYYISTTSYGKDASSQINEEVNSSSSKKRKACGVEKVSYNFNPGTLRNGAKKKCSATQDPSSSSSSSEPAPSTTAAQPVFPMSRMTTDHSIPNVGWCGGDCKNVNDFINYAKVTSPKATQA